MFGRTADDFIPIVAELAKTFGWPPKLFASLAAGTGESRYGYQSHFRQDHISRPASRFLLPLCADKAWEPKATRDSNRVRSLWCDCSRRYGDGRWTVFCVSSRQISFIGFQHGLANGVPDAAQQNHPQLEYGLCACLLPTHPRKFQTLGEDRLAGALDPLSARRA